MPKAPKEKKSVQVRHTPLDASMSKTGKGSKKNKQEDQGNDEIDDGNSEIPESISLKILNQAKFQRQEMEDETIGSSKVKYSKSAPNFKDTQIKNNDDSDDEEMSASDGEMMDNDLVEFDGEFVSGSGLSEAEESVVQKFLLANRNQTRTLADIIMEKIREKEDVLADETASAVEMGSTIPPKVVEVYTSLGKMLAHYKSGKLPKALKMLPHLKNWEEVLLLTRPDQWSPGAMYACTRIFSSNLNSKMAQRFYNLVLMEKCRDDIRSNNKLNYHLYMALKKSLFKPAAFYKGILLPLAQSQSCTLREATIIGSVLAKVSIQGTHSAAALLRLAEMPYSGSTSLFIKILLNKKYALPRRVIDALVNHFSSFETETRVLPVLWHQSLLVFAQRYKHEIDDSQKEVLKQLLRSQFHHQMTPEIRRELFNVTSSFK